MTMPKLKAALLVSLLGVATPPLAQELETTGEAPLSADDEVRVEAEVLPGIPPEQEPGESWVNEYAFEPAFKEQSRKEREGFDMPPEPVGNILRMGVTFPQAGD